MICRNLRDNIKRDYATEKCNLIQKSFLKECIDMEIKREYYLD